MRALLMLMQQLNFDVEFEEEQGTPIKRRQTKFIKSKTFGCLPTVLQLPHIILHTHSFLRTHS